MNIEFDLRLKAFNRSLGVLGLDEHVALWKGKAPVIFTTKHDEAVSMAAARWRMRQRSRRLAWAV